MAEPSTDQYHFSEQIGHLLRRAFQRHMAIFQETVPDSQLTPTQFVVLCSVRELEDAKVPDIVKATAIDESSVRGIVERLKWRYLVTVDHAPGDARHMKVRLTADGIDLIEQTVPYARLISELTLGELSPDDRATLVRLLRRISGL